MRDGPRFRELHQAPGTRDVGEKIADIESARIEMIAGEQNAGGAIVISDVRGLMTGDRQHVEDASAKVDRTRLAWPVRNAEGLLLRLDRGRDQGDVRQRGQVLISGDMVAVGVRMDHYQRNRRPLMRL